MEREHFGILGALDRLFDEVVGCFGVGIHFGEATLKGQRDIEKGLHGWLCLDVYWLPPIHTTRYGLGEGKAKRSTGTETEEEGECKREMVVVIQNGDIDRYCGGVDVVLEVDMRVYVERK